MHKFTSVTQVPSGMALTIAAVPCCQLPSLCLVTPNTQYCIPFSPRWGAADAEIEVPSVGNTELKGSPLKAWSRSVYDHTCYA